MRSGGGGDGGSGGGGGDGDGVGESGLRRRMREQGPDWWEGHDYQGGARPADAPSLGEVVGRRKWKRMSGEGRGGGGGGGGRSGGGDGGTGRTGSASQHLSVVKTGRGRCSRLPLVCRVSQRRPQGLLNLLSPPCRNHHHQPVSCHMTGSHCEMHGEKGLSDWLSS